MVIHRSNETNEINRDWSKFCEKLILSEFRSIPVGEHGGRTKRLNAADRMAAEALQQAFDKTVHKGYKSWTLPKLAS